MLSGRPNGSMTGAHSQQSGLRMQATANQLRHAPRRHRLEISVGRLPIEKSDRRAEVCRHGLSEKFREIDNDLRKR